MSEANNAIFAKIACALEAYVDEDNGEVTVVESDIQQDLSDVSESVIAVLTAAGVCLAELDERIMQEDITIPGNGFLITVCVFDYFLPFVQRFLRLTYCTLNGL